MNRRTFIHRTASGLGWGLIGSRVVEESKGAAHSAPSGRQVLRATDRVTLGRTGIRASRLAIGTGSNGAEQRQLGKAKLAKLLRSALDRGLNWWETADLYKTHPHVGAALREVQREKVVITSKTLSKDAAGVRADVERFRRELGTDYVDILLLHCMSAPDWPEKMKGAMEALSEAKEKGHARAIGCSLHIQSREQAIGLGPLQAAADTPWGDVVLVRINPFAVNMDVERTEDIPLVERIFRAMHERGKAIYGMKVLGGTDPHRRESRIQGGRIDESLKFILGKPYVSGFTIGFSRKRDIDDMTRRIEQAGISRAG